jgi:hypothetical protein
MQSGPRWLAVFVETLRRLPRTPAEWRAAGDRKLAGGPRGVDRAWYLETHPDVAAARVDPVHHYMRYGWCEGRDPRPDFSTRGYLALHEEVARAGQNPLIHHLRHGRHTAPRDASGVTGDYELARGERGVDRGWYLERYPDVAAAGMDPVHHYLDCGWREGRDPRRDFSTCGYLAVHEDVARSGRNPFVHYLRRGGPKGPARDIAPTKTRGILGVVADASGAHLFPALVAALLLLRDSGKAADPVWIIAVAAWAFGCGLRGILWHQLHDIEHDRKAEVQTFVLRHSRRAATRLAGWVALPIEAIGLAVLLWRMQSLLPVAFLLLYAAFATLRQKLWTIPVVVVAPRERYSVLGQEYYGLLFPLGILISLVLHHPVDGAVLVAHLLLFPGPAVWFGAQAYWLARDVFRFRRGSRA